MRPQAQTIFGRDGNCLAACVATLFGVDLADVPHFCELDDGSWHRRLVEWCRPRNVYPLYFMAKGKDVWAHWCAPGQVVIVEGRSPRGYPHRCLYRDGELFWDPHRDASGIEAVETVFVFTVIEPDALERAVADEARALR